ncbi:hypothetical protein NHQ30_007362 [Ciborinia camelliae]|nr:hypothetical protein NHQ30_007362 [Ciborinia camelliae]
MADFNFPGIDLSDPFVPNPGSISVYSPFEHNTPKLAVRPLHDYGTFTYPLTPEDEWPNAIPLPLRSRDSSLNSPPSLSFSRSSSTSSRKSFSSSTSNIMLNRFLNAKGEPPTSFPHFTSLPLDIQRNIWRHTLPGPQIVEIYRQTLVKPQSTPSSTTNSTQQTQAQETLPLLKTYTTLPIALHVHRLSRRLALSLLSPLSFAHPYYLLSNPYAYINYIHDTIFLSSHTLYSDLGNHILYSRNLHKIRYLALEFETWCELLGDNHFVNALLEMEGLVEIAVVFEVAATSCPSISSPIYRSSFPSSMISTHREESIQHWENTLKFLEPTEEEERELEDVFERECEKKWLWGRVRGWEDVKSKLRLKWKEGESRSASSIQRRAGAPQNEKGNEGYARLRSGPAAKGNIQIGYQEFHGGEGSGLKTGFEQRLESLLNSVDDVIMDYGHIAHRRGGEEMEYSESEYSASFEDDSDLEGWI